MSLRIDSTLERAVRDASPSRVPTTSTSDSSKITCGTREVRSSSRRSDPVAAATANAASARLTRGELANDVTTISFAPAARTARVDRDHPAVPTAAHDGEISELLADLTDPGGRGVHALTRATDIGVHL